MNHELPKSWIKLSLDGCAEVIMGQSPKGITVSEERDGLPFYQGKAEFRQLYPIPKKYCSAPTKIAKEGDILLSIRAPVGPTNLCPAESCIGRGLAAIRSYEGINQNFLLHYFRNIEPWLSEQGTGSTFKAISGGFLRSVDVLIPPTSEQIRIADMLDRVLARVNAAQARLDKIPTLIKRFRQSVLAAATSGELTQEWRDMHNIDPTYVTLGDAGIVIKTGPFGSALHKEEYIHGGIPVINPMHIKDGEIAPSSDMTITESKFDELNGWHLQEGDIVIGRRGEMGRAAEVPKHSGSMLCGTGSMIIRSEPERILPAFLCLVLRSPNAIRYFEGNAIGSTMVNLNQKVIKNLPFHYPSLDEQKEIVRRVESLFAIADSVEKQYQDAKARTDRMTQAILAKAFRGELVPQDPNDEPAEVLLQRIRQQRAEQATAGKRGKAHKVSG